jgi:hypothetical protein
MVSLRHDPEFIMWVYVTLYNLYVSIILTDVISLQSRCKYRIFVFTCVYYTYNNRLSITLSPVFSIWSSWIDNPLGICFPSVLKKCPILPGPDTEPSLHISHTHILSVLLNHVQRYEDNNARTPSDKQKRIRARTNASTLDITRPSHRYFTLYIIYICVYVYIYVYDTTKRRSWYRGPDDEGYSKMYRASNYALIIGFP